MCIYVDVYMYICIGMCIIIIQYHIYIYIYTHSEFANGLKVPPARRRAPRIQHKKYFRY